MPDIDVLKLIGSLKEFAGKIKTFREQLGFTQEDVAQKIGVQPQTYAAWEDAKVLPMLGQLNSLASTFKVPLGDLLGKGATESLLKQFGIKGENASALASLATLLLNSSQSSKTEQSTGQPQQGGSSTASTLASLAGALLGGKSQSAPQAQTAQSSGSNDTAAALTALAGMVLGNATKGQNTAGTQSGGASTAASLASLAASILKSQGQSQGEDNKQSADSGSTLANVASGLLKGLFKS